MARVLQALTQVQLLCFISLTSMLPFGSGTAFAQNPVRLPDSTQVIRDSLITPAVRIGESVLTTADSAGVRPTRADTVQVSPKAEAAIRKIVPKTALLRSLALPGLGQIYNKQPWKVPFVYAGLATCGYFFLYYRGYAADFEDGYRRLLYGDIIEGKHVAVKQVNIRGAIFETTQGAKRGYDLTRRYRDLNIFLFAGVWLLNAVEANVAAHLRTFDLSDDLTLHYTPAVIPTPNGPIPGLRLALTLK